MVAIIKTGKVIKDAFYYNENKVKEGKAVCLLSENFFDSSESLKEQTKLKMLQKMAGQNTRAKVNGVHISLNFSPSDNLSENTFKEIAKVYMEKIGFGNQPYLVYQHLDAGHPHMHIVTTNIEADGKRIDLHHLGIRKSEPARKEIEKNYRLICAEDQKQKPYQLKPVQAGKVIYGRSESRRAITAVLDIVLPVYKYSSLHELNAVLNQYNVMADRGEKTSRTYQKGGLFYRILDESGKPVGVPIKASAFYNKPTLKFLEKRFIENSSEKMKHKAQIKNTVDLYFIKSKNPSLENLSNALKKEGMVVVIRQNKEGLIYGLTYVDHVTKCVFNGSDLGKEYSAKGIQERCHLKEVFEPKLLAHSAQKPSIGLQSQATATATETKDLSNDLQRPKIPSVVNKLFEKLTQPEYASDYIPYQLKKKKKRKKKAIQKNGNNQ